MIHYRVIATRPYPNDTPAKLEADINALARHGYEMRGMVDTGNVTLIVMGRFCETKAAFEWAERRQDES